MKVTRGTDLENYIILNMVRYLGGIRGSEDNKKTVVGVQFWSLYFKLAMPYQKINPQHYVYLRYVWERGKEME